MNVKSLSRHLKRIIEMPVNNDELNGMLIIATKAVQDTPPIKLTRWARFCLNVKLRWMLFRGGL